MRKSHFLLAASALVALLAVGCSSEEGHVAAPESKPSSETFVLESETGAQPEASTAKQEQAAAKAEPSPIEAKYNQSCFACHGTGAAGAPRKGDVEAWKPRLAQGMDTLLEHTKKGYRAMPPKGMCFDCTDEQYVELITFMAGEG